MSRAEKKLAEEKAKIELKKLKAEKKQQQKEDWEKSKEQFNALPKNTKTAITIIGVVLLMVLLFAIFSSSNNLDNQEITTNSSTETTQQTPLEAEPKVKTSTELMLEGISSLFSTNEAFDTGSYVKGDIPIGEYAFITFEGSGKYYSEEDVAGNIIDNENFDSFGYVYVQGAGNIQSQGVLISISAFEKLDVSGAKEIYEKLNDIKDYKDSAIYKVGVDIKPDTYTVASYGEGYVEIMSGPVGNSEIIDNEIFNGKYSVTVKKGNFLKISTGKLL